MADAKISALPASTTPLAGTEVLPIVQSSTTKKVSVENLTAGRAVSMASVVTTGKGNFGNGPNAVIARADVGVHFANRTSTATTANLFVATSNEQGADIGGSIAMGGYVDATSNIPLATWSGRKFNGSSGNYAGYALLTVSNSGGGAVDTTKILSDGSIRLLVAGAAIDFGSSVIWRTGAGTPEGAVTAAVGSLYTRTDGGLLSTLYVKESGAGNTGWVAK
jgi:hypothetical protein